MASQSVSDVQPTWANKQYIRQRYGVSKDIVARWVADGLIRTVKTGPSQQAGRIYNLGDVEGVLEALAAGLTPKPPRYRARKGATK